ncbi:proton channel OtopLc-like isoform X1 [Haliotis rubra]|uniref:proton channel OtopLc-like isoform X1 n=2 Tax=Haliotis rubra TaxID=36100 RepID=UPI001EE50646|nr:proton channel OtopLc-like isoform X1 [Haliotis rubra]
MASSGVDPDVKEKANEEATKVEPERPPEATDEQVPASADNPAIQVTEAPQTLEEVNEANPTPVDPQPEQPTPEDTQPEEVTTPEEETPPAETPKKLTRLQKIQKRFPGLPFIGAMRSGTYIVNEPRDGADNGVVTTSKTPDNDDQVCLTKMEADAEEGVVASPEVAALQKRKSSKKNTVYRSAMTKLLCGLYCLLLVVFGIVFAVANALTVKEREHKYYLEAFLVYLYAGSLIVLLYLQIGILRGVKVRQNFFDHNIKVVIRRSTENIHQSPSPTRRSNDDDSILDKETRKDALDQISTASNASMRSQLALPADGEVAHVGEGINFYLRLGALAFSIGSVTLDGFHISSYFETENTETCESKIFTLVYVLHLIFTFVQTFFLFKNHKLVIDKCKPAVRFGLMHLLATNICVWAVTAVTETAEDSRQQDYFARVRQNHSSIYLTRSCYEEETVARTASPYLFPCTIMYSIIAAGIIYRMYQHVGVKVKQRWPSHTSLTSSAPHGAASMDCEKANKGLFSGLLIAVVTLIAIATFFVFEARLKVPETAINVFFVMELALLSITGVCIVIGHIRLTQLKFMENYFLSLDSVLLAVAVGGAYVYLSFMLISAASTVSAQGLSSILSLVVITLGLIQSTMQTVFILDGLCRCSENDSQIDRKPGRAIVTFTLVCNLALWVVGMFENKKTTVIPFHQDFYGILSWNIILHLCVPLYIFFRFHSAICLSKIWYQAYQKEKMP